MGLVFVVNHNYPVTNSVLGVSVRVLEQTNHMPELVGKISRVVLLVVNFSSKDCIRLQTEVMVSEALRLIVSAEDLKPVKALPLVLLTVVSQHSNLNEDFSVIISFAVRV